MTMICELNYVKNVVNSEIQYILGNYLDDHEVVQLLGPLNKKLRDMIEEAEYQFPARNISAWDRNLADVKRMLGASK